MKFIKVLNNPNGVECMSGTFAIYELETEAELKAAHRHKYLVHRKFSELAMTELDVIEDLISVAVHESEYVYGVGFCDTIRECELFYTAVCLQVFLTTFRITMKDFVNQFDVKSAQARSLENVGLRCSANLCPSGFSIQELDTDTCISCPLYPCSYYSDDDQCDDLDEVALENEQRELHYGGQSEFRDHWTLDE